MASPVIIVFPRRFRSRYRRRQGGAGALGVAVAVLAAGAGAHAATSHAHAGTGARPARVTAVSGTGEAAFFTRVLADLGAPATSANLGSLAAWAAHEGPWGSVGAWNPLDTILPEPGSWAFNSFGGGLHVQSYPTASEGAQATAVTIGGYPGITAALRSGAGVCGPGLSYEFSRWSGGGYTEVC
jgi:hypothetical protein